MTRARTPFPGKPSRQAGKIGTAALAASALLSWFAPAAAAPAYRFAAFACLQPALGSLIFGLIYRITGGQWGAKLDPFFRAGIRLLPWIWPLVAWLALVPAAHPTFAALPAGPANPGAAMLLLRAAVYELIFAALRIVALRPEYKRLAAPGLLLLVLTLHVLAADWFFTLEPGWTSTGFPLVWMSVQATAGLSWAILMAALCGRSPAEVGPAGRPFGADWGNLLLTAIVFSSYVAFMEFLVIWSGNLPSEITWFLHRDSGVWRAVIIALALFHLFFPLGCLLSKPLKASRRGLPRIAALVCGAELLWCAWFILPPFKDRGLWLPCLCATLLIGGGGIFINRYFAGLPAEGNAP
jgi:hypothetical protein